MTFSQKSVFKKTQSNLAKMGSFGRVWDYLNLLKRIMKVLFILVFKLAVGTDKYTN